MKVDPEEGRQLASEFDMKFFEINSKYADGLNEAFEDIIGDVILNIDNGLL